MNKYLKLIIPAALLLTTSAFARENSSELFLKEKVLNNVPAELAENIKIELQKSYIENSTNKELIKENIKALCQGNKYCLANAELMLRSGVEYKKIIENLTKETNHKQALYNTKYAFAKKDYKTYETLQMLEIEQIVELNSFKEFKDYITDMPMLSDSFDSVFEILSAYFADKAPSKEETSFIKSFGKDSSKNLPTCAKNLNMQNYGYENICSLPINHFAKKHFVKEIEKVIMNMSNQPEFEAQNNNQNTNEFVQAKQQIKNILKEWKKHITNK